LALILPMNWPSKATGKMQNQPPKLLMNSNARPAWLRGSRDFEEGGSTVGSSPRRGRNPSHPTWPRLAYVRQIERPTAEIRSELTTLRRHDLAIATSIIGGTSARPKSQVQTMMGCEALTADSRRPTAWRR
jgi:hypothetical protein